MALPGVSHLAYARPFCSALGGLHPRQCEREFGALPEHALHLYAAAMSTRCGSPLRSATGTGQFGFCLLWNVCEVLSIQ